MKTAILISGQMRTFAQCYPTQRSKIFCHYEPDIHFFVSCVHDAQSESAFLLEKDYKNVHIERYIDATDLPVIPDEKGAWAPYANATTHQKLMLQHWGNFKAFTFFKNTGKDIFDTVIRIRPDQWVHRFQPPPNPAPTECYCPWWGKFGGVNDRLAVMGVECAEPYFGMMNDIQLWLDKGFPFHPESLLELSLRSAGISVHNTLMGVCSTQRLDGSRRWAEVSLEDHAELTYELHREASEPEITLNDLEVIREAKMKWLERANNPITAS